MKKNTIKQLNELNTAFYKKVADSFDAKRQYPWSGWQQLLPTLQNMNPDSDSLEFVDFGCGNGRWFEFVSKNLSKDSPHTYTGIDSNAELLQIAQQKTARLKLNANFKKADIVNQLLERKFEELIPTTESVTVFTAFGVLHHIPSEELRNAFLTIIAQKMKPDDLCIITTWNFADDPRFESKKVPPNKVGILDSDLEHGDYILNWASESQAFRYCHASNQQELLTAAKQAQLEIKKSFYADGKSQQLNTYYLLTKKG